MWWIGLVVATVLAFVFVRFAIVKEGTAKSLMSFGEFSKIVFRWKDHWMDADWNIWRTPKAGEDPEEGSEGKEKSGSWDQKVFGGLMFYIWPFQRVHQYKHRWTDIRLQQTEMVVEFHEETLDHVLLKPAVYAFKLFGVETKPPERIPVDVVVLVTLRIQNPYLVLFVAPPTPVEDILARISAETRALITSCPVDKLLELKGESVWELMRGAKVIESTLERWGVKLAEKGVEIQKIILPPDYQAAGAAKRKQEMLAEGRAEEIMGSVIFNVAAASGREKSLVQAEFLEDPQQFYDTHGPIMQSIMTKLSMEEKAYFRSEVIGGAGISQELIPLLGALKKILPGLLEKDAKKEAATGEQEKTEPARPKSLLSSLPSSLPRKLTKEEKAKLKEELDSLPKELGDQWHKWIIDVVSRGLLKM